MDYGQKQCPYCGTINAAQSIACQNCGRQFSPGAPPPPAWQAQPGQMGAQGVPQGQPGPMGAPQAPYPGQDDNAPPPYPTGTGGGYGAPPAPQKQKKKRKKGCLIAALSVAGALVLGVGAILFFALRDTSGGTQITDDYSTLLTFVCASKTPEGVAAKEGRVAEFDGAHPGEVEDDLQTLVDTCVDYTQADAADAARYTDALAALEELSDSKVASVSRCAKRLVTAVDEAYTESGLAVPEAPTDIPVDVPVPPNSDSGASAPPNSDSGASAPPPNSGPPDPNSQSGATSAPMADEDYMPLDTPGYLGRVDGSRYTFEAVNHSGKDIVWYEYMVYCYDANGNPIVGNDGTNWEWAYADDKIPAGATISQQEMGYWSLSNCPGAQNIIPLVSYVEYSDGTVWGVTSDDFTVTEDVETWSTIMGIYADAMATALLSPG